MTRIIHIGQNWNNKLALNQFSIIVMRDDIVNFIDADVEIRCKSMEPIYGCITYIKNFKWNGLTAAMTRINYDQPRRGGETIMRRVFGSRSTDIDKQQFSFLIIKKYKSS